ncbi:MAG: methyltransferase domain-containing protein [Anaerolineae bacterium]
MTTNCGSKIDYDKIASEYARHRRVHPEVLRSLLATSGIGRGSRVLEVGCGTGNYVIAVEASVGCPCWGIDPSPQMLDKARERSGTVKFQPGSAQRLDSPPDSFDLVFSVDVIHHLSDRLGFLREAYRVLKAGGEVCTVTDSEWIVRHRQPLAVYFPETVEVDLNRYPRMAELRGLMEEVGFVEITEEVVEFPYELTDVQAYRDKAFSSLCLISQEGFRQGIQRMERDLDSGPISCVSRYVLLWGAKGQARD